MPLHQYPAALLQTLLRFDTTNPPGHEIDCMRYLQGVLQAYNIPVTVLAKDPQRPNLIARLPGSGQAPPLLLQGHVDVVPTADQPWTVPPFAGLVNDGFIWGRGALDMKAGVTMMLAAMLRLKAEKITPRGDIVLCLLSDEEAGGQFGARFLVEEHPELFAGVKVALGEFGGFPLHLGGRKFYPIQIAEKLQCSMRVTVRGAGGHGSMPVRGQAMAKLGQVLTAIDKGRTPIHITPPVRLMLEGLAEAARPPANLILRQLLNPGRADAVLALLGPRLRVIEPLLRNTVSPTIIRGGHKINVIPSEATLDLDGRMLPGFKPAEMVAELRAIIGEDAEVEVLIFDPPAQGEPDLSQFSLLADTLRRLDPDGIPVPFVLPGVSDARFFARLGIQNYGFTPMNLPADFNFTATIHAADERIPVEAVHFGTEAMTQVLRNYGLSSG